MSGGGPPPSPSSVQPHATISAQDIAQARPARCGFLRKRGQKERVFENLHLSRHINWRQKFVAISDGCCYCYQDEVAKAPMQAFSLQGYNRVFRSSSERAAFVFTIEPDPSCRKKVYTFAASSDDDRILWMKTFKEAMVKANDVESSQRNESAEDDDIYVELEKPVYEPPERSRHRSDAADDDDDHDDDESGESDDSDYDRPDEGLVKKANQRRNVPLPPVPATEGGGDENNSHRHSQVQPEPAPRSSRPLPKTRGKEPSPPPKPRPPDPRERKALPLPTAKTAPPTGPRKLSSDQGTPRRKPPSPDKTRRLSERDSLFGTSDREAAIEVLREKKAPGTFLIRNSRQGDSKVLVVMTTEDVKEYKIFAEEDHQVSLDRKSLFATVDELLEHYAKTPLPNRQQTLSRSFNDTF